MANSLTLALAGFSLAVAAPAMAEPFLPTFDAREFTGNTVVTHAYFPVIAGQVRTYAGSPANEAFILTGLGSGPIIMGIRTNTVRDRAFEEGRIVEDTFDYYAQDRKGNVWYFGEDVTNYFYDRAGNLTGTNSSSSWRAGVNGALPGYIMPADLRIGFNYYQEHAPADEALDQATTYAVVPSFTISSGTYKNVLQVLETSELDPQARGFKYYAPGVGLIFEAEGLRPNNKNPRQVFELVTISSEAR